MPKTVVITGSTSGIGLAAAVACLNQGANVLVSSEQATALQQTLDDNTQFGDRIAGMVCDVTDRDQISTLLRFAIERFGHIDCWINNAGTTAPSGATSDVPYASGELLLSTNVMGCYYGSVAALRHFRSNGHGRLINMVGRGEKSPVPGANLYSSSKAWARNFTLALAKEEKANGIEVGTFNPGFTITALTMQPRVLANSAEEQINGLKKIMPLIGDTADKPGGSLGTLALQDKAIKPENVHRSLLPFVLKRLLTGQRAKVDVNNIEQRIIEPETD